MYYFKTRTSGKFTDMATGGKGRIARTRRGDICAVGSLFTAQQAAKTFASYGLLG